MKTSTTQAYEMGFHITMKHSGKYTSCTCRRGKHTVYVKSAAKDPVITCRKKLKEYCIEHNLTMDEAEIAKEDTTPLKMDAYQKVTDKILEKLEEGTLPWLNPVAGFNLAYNFCTDKPYTLVNQLLLDGGAYASYKQWQQMGGQVRKGSKGEPILTWFSVKPKNDDEDSEDETEENSKCFLKAKMKTVFSIDCVDWPMGKPDWVEESLETKKTHFYNEPIDIAETVLDLYAERSGVAIKTTEKGVNFYDPTDDSINLCEMSRFRNSNAYYATAFHEAGHSTGVAKRLARKDFDKGRFGNEPYSKEELVAEMCSAYLMNLFGLETEGTFENSASYIDGWRQRLKEDTHMFINCACQAEKAAQYILNNMTPEQIEAATNDRILPF